MVTAVLSQFLAKKKKFPPAALEQKLFDVSQSLPRLADLSVNGSLLSPKFTR